MKYIKKNRGGWRWKRVVWNNFIRRNVKTRTNIKNVKFYWHLNAISFLFFVGTNIIVMIIFLRSIFSWRLVLFIIIEDIISSLNDNGLLIHYSLFIELLCIVCMFDKTFIIFLIVSHMKYLKILDKIKNVWIKIEFDQLLSNYKLYKHALVNWDTLRLDKTFKSNRIRSKSNWIELSSSS